MPSAARPVVCITTPGTPGANNGNWRTAARWSELLRDRCEVIVQTEWDGKPADILVALHARRSAGSIERFALAHPGRPIVVVLTGTDLYRDLPESGEAIASLDRADRIVVLQDDALRLLEPRWRAKAQVIFQSAAATAPAPEPRDRLECVMVGHLRAEKDPLTLFAAMRHVPREVPIRMRHIGAPLDEALATGARALALEDPRYVYLGGLSHEAARAAMSQANLLVHPSVVEGGANVIVEAITAGTPVIASRISGNVGMLGSDYPGLFEARDARGLAGLLVKAWKEPAWRDVLRDACALREPLFRPEAERAALLKVLTTGDRPLLSRGETAWR
jgi:putative glycosyltransferase (TIGR04348 family)